MSENRYALAGWLAIAAGVMFLMEMALGVVFGIASQAKPGLCLLVLFVLVPVAMFEAGFNFYALYRFRTLLHERYRFRKTDLLITIMLYGGLVMTGVMLLFRTMEVLQLPKLILVPMMLAGLFGIGFPLAAIGIVFSVKLLSLNGTLNGLLKPLAYTNIVGCACFLTFFLAPIGILLMVATNIILGIIMLSGEEEVVAPEFV